MSHMSFRLVPNSLTLNDLERCSGRYFALFTKLVYDIVVKSSRSLSHLLMSSCCTIVIDECPDELSTSITIVQ